MSPWDLETVDQSRIPAEKGGSVEVLQEEIQASLYQSMDPESWPPSGDRDIECHRFMEGIEKVMDLSVAEPFLAPVDLNLYPSYALLIAYPVDLTTIKTRLENRFYRSIQALQFDVRYVASNAEKYNQRSSLIVKQANIVTDLCLKITTEDGQIDVI
jgi:bromodomain and WD repeat domain containing protein 1/3